MMATSTAPASSLVGSAQNGIQKKDSIQIRDNQVGSNQYTDAQTSSELERTQSSSSSVTVHPLGGNEEQKASSSSTSSSPTFQSASSSSAHKTNSTAASSMQIADSHSSSLQQVVKGKSPLEPQNASSSNSRVIYGQAVGSGKDAMKSNGYARMDETESAIHNPQANESGWKSDRYQDEDEEETVSIHDEETPMQYPPFSVEEREARRIEQKLEQWAAEEKLRRKAKRSSRTASIIVTPSSTNRLAKRLSSLGGLNTSKQQTALSEPVPAAFQDVGPQGAFGQYGKRGTFVGSTDALVENDRQTNDSSQWRHEASSTALDGVEEASHDVDPSSNSKKGKAREMSDPFQDPITAPSSSYSSQRSKPSAHRPIVTPGRAPTIRHFAAQKAKGVRNGPDMPTIVATDVDEEKEAQETLAKFQKLEDNPFQTASEKAAEEQSRNGKRYTMQKSNSTYTIGSTVDDNSSTNKRKSTNSRFNEIGLDDEDDAAGWPDEDESGEVKSEFSNNHTIRNGDFSSPTDQLPDFVHDDLPRRTPWWSEWLCGCGTPTDADLEQSGRTFPE